MLGDIFAGAVIIALTIGMFVTMVRAVLDT